MLYSLEILTKEKSEILSRMDQISSRNKELLEENDSLKKSFVDEEHTKQSCKEENEHCESDLLVELFNELDILHKEYYLHGNTEKGKNMLMHHLSEQLNMLRGDEVLLRNVEGHINNNNGGLLTEIYNCVRLNADQKRIVALLGIGFSKEVVCQIMGLEMSSFYNRMNRLSKRIEDCASCRKNELLVLIGRGKG